MGSISNPLSSASSSSSANSTTTFTGTSSYSKDFQNLIDRATAIASLPITPLTDRQDSLNAQSGELTRLDAKFTALQNAIQQIQDAMGGSALKATVSQPSVLTATPGDGAAEATFSLNVTRLGSYSSSLSAATWNNSADSSGKPAAYNLIVGDNTYTIHPADNSAASVVAAINAQYGNLVHASAVNVNPSDTADWRISLQSATLGPGDVGLQAASQSNLQRQQSLTTEGYAVSQSAWSWDSAGDPSGAATTYTLAVGKTQLTFSLTDNSAGAVADAINRLTGNPVHATVVDLGTATNHDYRLRLQNNTAGNTVLDLRKSTPVNLQNQLQPPGELAQYSVVGSGITVSSKTRSIQVSDGTTLTLTGTGTSDVTVMRSTEALDSALTAFTSAYNAAFDEVTSQHGQAAGPLQGDPILYTLQQTLRSLSTYSASGPIGGISALGLNLGTNGHITYNALQLMAADLTNSAGVTAFFGAAGKNGFLNVAAKALDSIENATTGTLKTAESATQSQLTQVGKTIADKQNQVQQLQLNLQNQMAQSDALIAAMEQQYSYMSSMFSAMQTADQMYSK